MTNYVYHYLYGSTELLNFLEEKRFDLPEFPTDLEWKEYDKFSYHIQFSTRGMNYPLELIELVLKSFADVTWYAMEENCVRQAKFHLEDNHIVVEEREVTETVNDNILALQLDDVNGKAQEYLFLFESSRCVIEHFVENWSSEIQFSQVENQKIQEQLKWLCQQVYRDDWGACIDTLASKENQICCYPHFKDYDYTFENPIYDGDVADEKVSEHFTVFYQQLKQLLESKQIRNLL